MNGDVGACIDGAVLVSVPFGLAGVPNVNPVDVPVEGAAPNVNGEP